MIWTSPITADGATATPEQLTEAWERWTHDHLKTATRLASILTAVGVEGATAFWPTGRLADRMLQRARKASAIRYVKGRWEVVDGE